MLDRLLLVQRRGFGAVAAQALFAGLSLCASLALLEGEARAQDYRADTIAVAPVATEAAPAEATAATGAFSVWALAARSDTQRGLARLQGGYDGTTNGATFEAAAEARLTRRVSLRAGGTMVANGASLYPSVSARLDVLRQESEGVDLAVSGGYEGYGFNTVAAAKANVAIGRSLGPVLLLANVGYGYGIEEGERYGDVRLAASYRVADPLRVGVDSRLRLDLERDTDEPAGEPDWEAVAAPFGTVTVGSFAFTGAAGLSAMRLRFAPEANVGVLATGVVSTVF